jgi:hypothetical protein
VYVVRAKPDGHIDRGQVMITRWANQKI